MAHGDFLIFPKRVVFEGSKRSEIIKLANIGKDTAIGFFKIILVNWIIQSSRIIQFIYYIATLVLLCRMPSGKISTNF